MRVGFLGTGWIATYHSKSLRRSGAEIERAGCFDVDRGRAEAFAAASGHHVCASEDEVLDGCDAVYITTWTSEHPRLVAAAAERGLAIFCEKPLATNIADAERMLDAVSAAGVVNQVGLVLRHSPAYLWARHLITADEAGRVMTAVFRDDQFIPTQGHYASTWRADVARAGAGTLLEHSIHDLDMLDFLVGRVASVSALSSNFHGHQGIEDSVSAVLRFADAATATLTSVWHDNLSRPSLRHVEVFCERRFVAITGDDWFGPVAWSDADGREHSLAGDDLAAAVAVMLDGDPNPDAAFIAAARGGGAAFPDFATAVRAHRVADAIYRSAAGEGMPVAVAPDGPVLVDVTAADTLPLRQRVLRTGTASTDPTFPQDADVSTRHLGLRLDGALVAVSTWTPEPWPGDPAAPAVRLRGMAVDPDRQGLGLGGRLVEAGLGRAARFGARHVWANARDTALDFYLRRGFDVDGDGFTDSTTGLPHHVIVIHLP